MTDANQEHALEEKMKNHFERMSEELRIRKSHNQLNAIIEQMMPPAKKGYAARSTRKDRERR